MPDLPDVTQTFDANAAPFLAAVDAMIAALDRLAAAPADVRTAMVEMAAVADAAAGVVDAAMSNAARATDGVSKAMTGAAAATGATDAEVLNLRNSILGLAGADEILKGSMEDLTRIGAYLNDTFGIILTQYGLVAAKSAELDAMNRSLAESFGNVGTAMRTAAISEAELAAMNERLAASFGPAVASARLEAEQVRLLAEDDLAAAATAKILADAQAGLAARTAALPLLYRTLGAAANDAAKGTNNAAAAAGRATGFWARWGNIIHWVVMGTLEIAATAIPALVALGAAAAAMAPTFTHIADQMNFLRAATGSWSGVLANSVPVLQVTGAAMVRLRAAVAPDAYIIFGAAINSLIGHVGVFSGVAQQASNVLAGFASKLSAELQGPLGNQLAGFFANAVKYMIQWGQVLGNLGHTFVNVFTAMFGVGQLLLDVLVVLSRALLAITSNPIGAWLIGLAAAFSAAYRYAKLFQSAFTWLGGSAIVSGIKSMTAAVISAGYAFMAAGGGVAGFRDAIATLWAAMGPLKWVLLAITAALVIWKLSTLQAANSTDNLIASINKMPPTAANLSLGMSEMGHQLSILGAQMRTMSTTVDVSATANGRFAGTLSHEVNPALTYQQAQISKSIAEIQKLANETVNLVTGLTQAGMRTGQVGAAMQALSIQTAITDSKMQSVNQAFDQYVQILTGATSGNANFITSLANIGTIAATTANNLGTASSISLSASQFSKALTQMGTTGAAAWQNFDQVVSGSIQPLIDNLRLMGVTGALTGNQVKQAMIDMVVSTAKWAGGNQYAQGILMSMLNQVGIAPSNFSKFVASQQKAGAGQKQLNGIIMSGTAAFSKLSQMAKNAANAMNPMVANAIDAAALKSSGFSGALNKVISDLQNTHTPASVLNSDIAKMQTSYQNAISWAEQAGQHISSSGTNAASATHTSTSNMSQYWSNAKGKQKDLENQVSMSSSAISNHSQGMAGQVQSAMSKVISSMQKAGAQAGTLQRQLDSLHSPPPIVVTTIFKTVGSPVGAGIPGISNPVKPAAGGQVRGAGTTGSDSIPAWLSDGEFVMRSAAVKHYGVGFMHAINSQRFAGGGPVLTHSPVGGGAGGGSGAIVHNSHITVTLDGKVIGTALRTEYLTYNRRNTSANLNLRYR